MKANQITEKPATGRKGSLEIKDAYIRTYSDNGQTTAYVEWSTGGRTEGDPTGAHMLALMTRFARESGKDIRQETW